MVTTALPATTETVLSIGLGLGIIVVAALTAYLTIARTGRFDDDSTGTRSMTGFLMSGAYVTLWGAYYGFLLIVMALVGLIGKTYAAGSYAFVNGSFVETEKHPVGDQAVRMITVGISFIVIAGLAHRWHRAKGLELAAREDNPNAPAKKVVRSYVATVSFFAVAIAIVDLLLAVYTVVGIIAPGIFQSGGRTGSAKDLLLEAAVWLATGAVFQSTQRIAPAHLRLFGGGADHDHDHDHDHHHHDHGHRHDDPTEATVEHAEAD
jgi:hypothetical protein